MYLHLSDTFLSICVKHELDHDLYNESIPDDLKLEIEELSHRLPPALIFKELKSRENGLERIMNLTLSQVLHFNKFRYTIFGRKLMQTTKTSKGYRFWKLITIPISP